MASSLGQPGWRQTGHLSKKIKQLAQTIGRLAASKSPGKKEAMKSLYSGLLERTDLLINRAKTLVKTAQEESSSLDTLARAMGIQHWIDLTLQVCDTARRRVLLGESVPNCDKLFSLFEAHTQLYRRGKAGQPNQYGRLALIYEDGAGFISHYHLMDRQASDCDVVVEQTKSLSQNSTRGVQRPRKSEQSNGYETCSKIAQRKHGGAIERASFDRGFHSTENEETLQKMINEVCLLPRHPGQYAERLKNESVKFHQTRLHHSGVEAAIGVMQRGNGLKRCRDRSERGFERYLGLAILGRNIHTLGKLLIAERQPQSAAATTVRKAA